MFEKSEKRKRYIMKKTKNSDEKESGFWHRKKVLILAFCAIILGIFVFAALYLNSNPDSRTNGEYANQTNVESPSSANEPEMPRPRVPMDGPIYSSPQELYNDSDCVVIASFSEEPRNVEVYDETEHMIAEAKGTTPRIHYVTKYKLNTREVVKGDIEDKEITLFQLGQYKSGMYETSLEADTEYLLFLSERDYYREFDEKREIEFNTLFGEDKIMYQLFYLDGGIFEILEDDTLLPYADYGFSPSYDGKGLDVLLRDILGS